jgi:hypothetical protein
VVNMNLCGRSSLVLYRVLLRICTAREVDVVREERERLVDALEAASRLARPGSHTLANGDLAEILKSQCHNNFTI